MCFFGTSAFFSLPAAGLSSCSRLRGMQGARRVAVRTFGPWPRSVTRALGVQSDKSPQQAIPRMQSHPGSCKPTNRLKQCPTAHVISGILNIINVVRHYVIGDGTVFPPHQHARHATTFSTIRLRIWPYYFFVPFCEMNQLQTNPQPTLLRPSFAKLDQFNFQTNPQPNPDAFLCW